MGRCIIKLGDRFMEWSSISDAPHTPLLTEEQFLVYWRQEYGRARWHELGECLTRAKQNGSSYGTVDSILKNNRAGKKDRKLTKKEIIAAFTVENQAEFEEWSKRKDEYAEKQLREYTEIFLERNSKTT